LPLLLRLVQRKRRFIEQYLERQSDSLPNALLSAEELRDRHRRPM